MRAIDRREMRNFSRKIPYLEKKEEALIGREQSRKEREVGGTVRGMRVINQRDMIILNKGAHWYF